MTVAAAIVGIAAVPAQANSAATTVATSAAVEVKTAVEQADTPLGKGDEQFEQLFASWQQLDRDTGSKPPVATVSIPSRMPLDGAALTSGFGMRTHPVLGGRRSHKGIDLAAPTGTPVYATADGLVQMAQWYSSYGNYIQIGHGNEMETRYAHLSRIVAAEGSWVKKGELIGYVGSTGRSTGPHLHYEVRVAGVAVNPIPYMAESEAQEAFARATGSELAMGGE
ncbi:M23 family metallopeptidase [Parerythrobacter aurantius]|uniref:M23 family metallopeptidase n=1 Tax=Parerythrobacter aurantius TaxID=3127706 RepID=UPI00324D2EF4